MTKLLQTLVDKIVTDPFCSELEIICFSKVLWFLLVGKCYMEATTLPLFLGFLSGQNVFFFLLMSLYLYLQV